MDLLATVRKEGSRGGQGDFKWTDVQASSRREHYLGHSLMAPVGRWAKGRDLNWYAKGDDQDNDGEDAVEKAARERKEEIKRIKEAEEEALARALGLPVAPRTNANLEPVSDKREVDKVLREATHDEDVAVKGIGYDSLTRQKEQNMSGERIEGNAEPQDKELQYALKEYERRHRDDVQRRHKSRNIGIDRARGHIDEGLAHGALTENETGTTEIVQDRHVVHARKIADDKWPLNVFLFQNNPKIPLTAEVKFIHYSCN